MIKTNFEEIRVQVSISYEGIDEDNDLLDNVQNVEGFEACRQQMIGAYCLPCGFIIFEGTEMPTKEQKKKMEQEVKRAVKQTLTALKKQREAWEKQMQEDEA